MTKIKIIAAITLATGKSVPEVAKEHGFTKPTFYRAINNESKNRNRCRQNSAQDLISTLIGKPKHEIWPAVQQITQEAA